jgi:hypothetical protein
MTQILHKSKRIALVVLPESTGNYHVVAYDRKIMGDLPFKYVDPTTNESTLHFRITYSDTTPLYFVRSMKHIGYYYPIREDRHGHRSCRCLEFQGCGYCQHVDDLSAIAIAVRSVA